MAENTTWRGKKVLVVGLGVSGLCTAQWFASRGARVTVSEMKERDGLDPERLKELEDLGIDLETGPHREATFLNTHLIVLSPGVPHDMAPVRRAVRRGIPVTGEMEFAARLIRTPMLAVTGTNGKSTVTALLGELLGLAGFETFVGGNIGTPLMAYAASGQKADYVVVEVSSFQLDTMATFAPFVSLILNISPDHLDRYPDYEAYVQSKLRIFKHQQAGHYLILNDDDERLHTVRPASGVSILRYGLEGGPGKCAFLREGRIHARTPGGNGRTFSVENFHLPGEHNQQNLLAAVLAGTILDLPDTTIQQAIDRFKGLPDRLEWIGAQNGIRFYNDSKATNVDAAIKAIQSIRPPIILIAGGRHKGESYGALARVAREAVKGAVLLGESRTLLSQAFEGVIPRVFAGDLTEAVSLARDQAEPGDTVLLAPACSSFDMFTDYTHRGRVFKQAVEDIIRGR